MRDLVFVLCALAALAALASPVWAQSNVETSCGTSIVRGSLDEMLSPLVNDPARGYKMRLFGTEAQLAKRGTDCTDPTRSLKALPYIEVNAQGGIGPNAWDCDGAITNGWVEYGLAYNPTSGQLAGYMSQRTRAQGPDLSCVAWNSYTYVASKQQNYLDGGLPRQIVADEQGISYKGAYALLTNWNGPYFFLWSACPVDSRACLLKWTLYCPGGFYAYNNPDPSYGNMWAIDAAEFASGPQTYTVLWTTHNAQPYTFCSGPGARQDISVLGWTRP